MEKAKIETQINTKDCDFLANRYTDLGCYVDTHTYTI